MLDRLRDSVLVIGIAGCMVSLIAAGYYQSTLSLQIAIGFAVITFVVVWVIDNV